MQNSVAEGYFFHLCATSAAGEAGIDFSGGAGVCRCVCVSVSTCLSETRRQKLILLCKNVCYGHL